MKAVGYSDWKTYQALLTLAVPLAAFIAFMTLMVLPKVLAMNYQLLQRAQKESEMSIIQPGQFRTIGGNTTLFVADVDDKQFSKFFVWQHLNGVESITVAKSGKQSEKDGERYVELDKGSRYSLSPDGSSQLLAFETLTALLPTVKPRSRKAKMKAVPTQTLLADFNVTNRIELQRRVSPAISIVLLALCAPLLVQFNPRENRYGKFVSAILIYALYANSQYIFQAFIEDGKLPIVPGIHTSHLIFGGWLIFWAWSKKLGNRRRRRLPSAPVAVPTAHTNAVASAGGSIGAGGRHA